MEKNPSNSVSQDNKNVTTGNLSFDYRNTGKTPAKNVRVRVRAKLVGAGERIDLTDIGGMRQVGPMGPKDSFGREVPIEGLTHGADAKRHVEDGKEIHLWGEIKYDDEFTTGRCTTFHCYIGGDAKWEKTLHTAKDGNDYK